MKEIFGNLKALAAGVFRRGGGGLAEQARGNVNLRSEPVNVTAGLTVSGIQGMIRAAEGGDTRQLFALYRDLILSGSHVQAEFTKRKLAVISQPMSLLPVDKNNADDVAAAAAVQRMVEDCENWEDGLIHLLDATLWPVAVTEKVFRPATQPALTPEGAVVPLSFTLDRLAPVNHTLECYRQMDYAGRVAGVAGTIQVDSWEPGLRFWQIDERGNLLWGMDQTYPAEQDRHLVHRGHLLVSVQDCWGGPMRAVLFWWFLAGLGRDWFGRGMERFGSPFIVAKADMRDKELKTLLEDAFSVATKLFGLVVPAEAQVELKEVAASGMADAYEKFLNVCNREMSKVIVGQTQSAEVQAAGMGSGVADLHGEVREDYLAFDKMKLAATLRRQLFEQFLRINGLRGRAPKIVWGGESGAEAKGTAELLRGLADAGLEPVDDALPVIGERIGFGIQRRAAAMPQAMPQAIGERREGSEGGGWMGLAALSARAGGSEHVTDRIAAARAKALGEVYRGTMAPFREIILAANSREEAESGLKKFYADWKPERLAAELETGLQIMAAAGAAEGKAKG